MCSNFREKKKVIFIKIKFRVKEYSIVKEQFKYIEIGLWKRNFFLYFVYYGVLKFCLKIVDPEKKRAMINIKIFLSLKF